MITKRPTRNAIIKSIGLVSIAIFLIALRNVSCSTQEECGKMQMVNFSLSRALFSHLIQGGIVCAWLLSAIILCSFVLAALIGTVVHNTRKELYLSGKRRRLTRIAAALIFLLPTVILLLEISVYAINALALLFLREGKPFNPSIVEAVKICRVYMTECCLKNPCTGSLHLQNSDVLACNDLSFLRENGFIAKSMSIGKTYEICQLTLPEQKTDNMLSALSAHDPSNVSSFQMSVKYSNYHPFFQLLLDNIGNLRIMHAVADNCFGSSKTSYTQGSIHFLTISSIRASFSKFSVERTFSAFSRSSFSNAF